jgi:hypothetical protein
MQKTAGGRPVPVHRRQKDVSKAGTLELMRRALELICCLDSAVAGKGVGF